MSALLPEETPGDQPQGMPTNQPQRASTEQELDYGERCAMAEVMRLSEPGDRLLTALVDAYGAVAVMELIRGDTTKLLTAVYELSRHHEIQLAHHNAFKLCERWHSRVPECHGPAELKNMARKDARLVIPGDEQWPEGFSDLGLERPLGLWVRGTGDVGKLCDRSIAIVGSRAADASGLHLSKTFAWECISHGISVLSGGAEGIDAAAHASALRCADSPMVGSVAFMAGGVDRWYPQSNSELLTALASRYAVVSESPPGRSAMRHRFLLRNRLLAAASQVTLVVQAGWRSGAINTAHRAAELLRPVGAIPGSVHNAAHAGCHRLIREGAAVLVTRPDEVLELISFAAADDEPDDVQQRITDDLDDDQVKIYSALSPYKAEPLPAITVRAGVDTASAMVALGVLEVNGLAQRSMTGWKKTRS